MDLIFLFSALKSHTLSEELPSFESTFFDPISQQLLGGKENKKINKKKVKVSSSFKKRKFKPTVFNKISTLRFRFATTFITKSNPHFRTNLS
jgi:hypothetical protein